MDWLTSMPRNMPAPAALLAQGVTSGAWVLEPFGVAHDKSLALARAGYRVLVTANNPIERFLLTLVAQPLPRSVYQSTLAQLAASRLGGAPLENHLRALYAPNPEKLPTADALHRARALNRVAGPESDLRPYAQHAIDAYQPLTLYVLWTLINRQEQLDLNADQSRALTAMLLHVCMRAPRGSDALNLWDALETCVATAPAEAPAPVPLHTYPAPLPDSEGIYLFPGTLREWRDTQIALIPQALATHFPPPGKDYWQFSAVWAGWLWGAEAAAPLKVVLRPQDFDAQWYAEGLYAALGQAPMPQGAPLLATLPNEPHTQSAALLAAHMAGFTLFGLTADETASQPQALWHKTAPPVKPHNPFAHNHALAVINTLARQRGEPLAEPLAYLAGAAGLCADNAVTLTTNAVAQMYSAVQTALKSKTLLMPLAPTPHADQVEMDVVRLLVAVKETGITQAALMDELHGRYQGLLAPSVEWVNAVLHSYTEGVSTLRLAPQEQPAARRSDLERAVRHATLLGKALGFTTQSADPAQLTWLRESAPVWALHFSASALVGKWAQLPVDNARHVIVAPTARLPLLFWKCRRYAILRDWQFLSFESLKTLATTPAVTRDSWQESLQLL